MVRDRLLNPGIEPLVHFRPTLTLRMSFLFNPSPTDAAPCRLSPSAGRYLSIRFLRMSFLLEPSSAYRSVSTLPSHVIPFNPCLPPFFIAILLEKTFFPSVCHRSSTLHQHVASSLPQPLHALTVFPGHLNWWASVITSDEKGQVGRGFHHINLTSSRRLPCASTQDWGERGRARRSPVPYH